MARRTVENPDLEHRARRLGLTGKIREMEENGFVVIERAISADFADELRDGDAGGHGARAGAARIPGSISAGRSSGSSSIRC